LVRIEEKAVKRTSAVVVFAVIGAWCASCVAVAADGAGPNDRYIIFVDAVGEAIPQAKVRIYRRNELGENILVEETSLDESGNMLEGPSNSDGCTFIVSHPNYGLACASRCYLSPGIDNFVYFVPVVPKGSEADERSIRGAVLDPNHRPVSGARISCWRVKTRDGVTISGMGHYTVITDAQGRFRMHLPIEPSRTAYEVPAHSSYRVKIEPPKGSSLIFQTCRIPNDQDRTIVLERAEHFRTFKFEDADGPITEMERLKVIRLCVRLKGNLPWYIHYPDFKDGRTLPLGTFEAKMRANRVLPFERLEFEPIEVTAQSPQELVFRARPKPPVRQITCQGQVVSGLTSQPMAGVFIALARLGNDDFSAITPEQWQRLHELPERPEGNEPALEAIRNLHRLDRIVRSDYEGWFEIGLDSSEQSQDVVVFEQDYLAVEYDRGREKIFGHPPKDVVRLPVTRLYPGATVVFEPVVEEGPVEIDGRWWPPKDNGRSWFADFKRDYGSAGSFVEGGRFLRGRIGTMQIPAYMEVRIRLWAHSIGGNFGDSFLRPSFQDVITQSLQLSQGQLINLGKIKFEQLIPIFVQLVDEQNTGVGGIAVRRYHGDELREGHITDAQGFAEFLVPAYFEDKFEVVDPNSEEALAGNSIICRTNGPADANNVYTLQLSDEMLRRLFNED
jgi:hypothetical protein